VKYVAFLRAINTGNRRLRMAALREVYVQAGYPDAATYLATGNVVFERPKSPDATAMERFLDEALGFPNRVFLRSAQQIEALLDAVPWTGPGDLVEVSFLEGVPGADAARALEATAAAPEALRVAGSEVLFLREGKGLPTIHKESTTVRLLGMETTRRGMATVRGIRKRFLV
jgi:uncharacterized protein (DUF1697 family)